MSARFPGESAEYREARDRLLEREIELRRTDDGSPTEVRLAELFAPGRDSRALRLGGAALVPAGGLFGGAAVLFSSFVGLPIAASLFDAGDPIRDMPTLAGWVTFTVEHLICGFMLGLVAAALLRPGVAHTDVALQRAAGTA